MSDSLQSHGLQHAKLPCPLSSPRIYSNLCPLSQWCHLILISSPSHFSQSFPASGSFLVSWLFTSGGQGIESSASGSVLPVNIQCIFPLGLTGLISLLSKGLSRVFASTQFESINSLAVSLLYGPALTSIRDYWKNHSFDYMDLCRQRDVSDFKYGLGLS